jgi:TonB family protein
VRLVNNAEVNAEIRRRNSSLPRTVGPGGERLALFYPVTPLPARLEIAYAQGGVRDRLAVDTRVALVSAHRLRPPTLVARAEPDFPTAAAKAGMESGWVKARLSIDEAGDVMNVEVLESSAPRYFTRAAIATFRWWKYDPGPRTREAVEVMEFRR